MPWKDVGLARFHRLFYPQVPVVITSEFDGRVGGMPAIWCMPLSFNPPLAGVAIAPEHETYGIINGARAFGINWLGFSHARRIGELGQTSAKAYANKLPAAGFKTIKGKRTSQPLIQEASAAMECRLNETHRTGTHELVIGEVVNAMANSDFADYWNLSRYNPPLYVGTVNGKQKNWVFRSLRGKSVEVPLKSSVID
jgi:flavin reductase (DIM6/NTAB) family NADH-FMN oxidoreductase RutF